MLLLLLLLLLLCRRISSLMQFSFPSRDDVACSGQTGAMEQTRYCVSRRELAG